jgi:hypothetical protein
MPFTLEHHSGIHRQTTRIGPVHEKALFSCNIWPLVFSPEKVQPLLARHRSTIHFAEMGDRVNQRQAVVQQNVFAPALHLQLLGKIFH